jgi:mRNA-degrading endonuclease YafQ of YafQ-DinJ toxin-antitoxin module
VHEASVFFFPLREEAQDLPLTPPRILNCCRSRHHGDAKERYASTLHTHRLKGTLAECFASRLSREYRIVFVLTADRVTFIDIGTHDDVYR